MVLWMAPYLVETMVDERVVLWAERMVVESAAQMVAYLAYVMAFE